MAQQAENSNLDYCCSDLPHLDCFAEPGAVALKAKKCDSGRTGENVMAKKRISSTDLNWKIIEHMREGGDFPLSIAVVADPKLGWRAIVGSHRARSLSLKSAQRLAAIEKRLQGEYALSAD
jgi:hypothetical protein